MSARVLLLFDLCLWRTFVQALTCYECPRINAVGACETMTGTCKTRGIQQCFLRKVYEGDRLQYAQQGCGSLCISFDFFRPNILLILDCCRNTSFCNVFRATNAPPLPRPVLSRI